MIILTIEASALTQRSPQNQIKVTDFAINVSFYLDKAVQDHVELYFDLKDIALSQGNVQFFLKKVQVRLRVTIMIR